MVAQRPATDGILQEDRDAAYARDLERARALSYARNQQSRQNAITPARPLSSRGSAPTPQAPGNSPRSLMEPGNQNGNDTTGGLGSIAGDTANTALNAAVPGASLASLWMSDLPILLRIMVAGKEFCKPGGNILLWPIVSIPYCLFGLGSLFFWMLQPRKNNGQEIKLADIRMGPIDMIIFSVTCGIWGMIILFFLAIFGVGGNPKEALPIPAPIKKILSR